MTILLTSLRCVSSESELREEVAGAGEFWTAGENSSVELVEAAVVELSLERETVSYTAMAIKRSPHVSRVYVI